MVSECKGLLELVLRPRGLEFANTRYIATRNEALFGDKAAIDCVEAFIAVQERSIQFAMIQMKVQNSGLVVSNHLLGEKGHSPELPERAVPMNAGLEVAGISAYQLDSLINNAEDNQLKLQMMRSKGFNFPSKEITCAK